MCDPLAQLTDQKRDDCSIERSQGRLCADPKRPRLNSCVSVAYLAKLHWPAAGDGIFDASLVEQLYEAHLKAHLQIEVDGKSERSRQALVLEASGYLERFLWPNLEPVSSTWSHVMSVVVLINLKFSEGVSPWASLRTNPARFSSFFERVLEIASERVDLTYDERTELTHFLIHCFQSLDDDMVRPQALRLLSLPMWSTLNPRSLAQQLAAQPQLQQPWKLLQKRRKKARLPTTP